MAGLQAQLKQLENLNEDMIGDHQRWVFPTGPILFLEMCS